MCEACKQKDELIAALRNLANGLQDSIVGLIEAFDAARGYLPTVAHPAIDKLVADAKKLAASHV